ncbi:unnamed protein product [Gongylonema pulchrum]|uniref:MuHD domain-containing protein n=1 Tax=Gongylonema pulchrum TaxID=637853 RepID=A0A183DLY2_9BILA|nr:unnamed protein product [Gongylonema pulchrum]
MLSLERCTASELPFALSTSNLLSASATIKENRVPIAMAIHEYIHAWFKGADHSKTSVRVFGTVLASFPATAVPALTDPGSDIDSLIFTLKNAEKIKTILPFKQIINKKEKSVWDEKLDEGRLTYPNHVLGTCLVLYFILVV